MEDFSLSFSSKKRRRNRMGRNACHSESPRTRNPTSALRTASAILLVLATSNAVTRSNGFGPVSLVQRSASALYFSGSLRKESASGGGGEGDEGKNRNNNIEEGIQDLFATLPTGNTNHRSKSAKPQRNRPGSASKNNRRNRNRNSSKNQNNKNSDSNSSATIIKERSTNGNINSNIPISSLLPPPIDAKPKSQGTRAARAEDDKVSQGLSSWEDFLAGGTPASAASEPPTKPKNEGKGMDLRTKKGSDRNERQPVSATNADQNPNAKKDLLPSIADLFPSDMSASGGRKAPTPKTPGSNKDGSTTASSAPALDGVLPVSDLFYRSVQSMSDDDDDDDDDDPNGAGESGDSSRQRDDEELPFSAEQSDQLTSSLNKIKIRRNGAKPKRFDSTTANGAANSKSSSNKSTRKKRKLQRRGMEMLVGGVPINADPPQRYVELAYRHGNDVGWKDAITTNSRDFGPMYYGPSVGKLSREEQGLYCEFFVNSTLKWNVCPKDLRALANKHENDNQSVARTDAPGAEAGPSLRAENSTGIDGLGLSSNSTESTMKDALRNRMVGSMKEAFSRASSLGDEKDREEDSHAGPSGELVFSIGVSREELEEASGDAQTATSVLERVLARSISTSSRCTGFAVAFEKLKLSDPGDGTTTVSAEFVLTIDHHESMGFAEVKKKCNEINSSLAQAMDDGDMQLAMAAAAKQEGAWPEDFRNRIVEEFLFEDDDGDGPLDETGPPPPERGGGAKPNLESTIDSLLSDLNYEVQGFQNEDRRDVPFGMPGSPVYSSDDIFLGGGNDGVFWNYAGDNADGAPYKGSLGLRMVDAVVEKAKQRHPRVIAIGDVHGCIDELQDLLRECDYRPGDLVVFLGDLVSKGPDSMAVVQMAREIGAIGVRGNHDFEVVRWHQAIMSGVDPPVVGSEHFHIANCLTKADMKWMYSLPWYISSPDLGALFVHAGFVSGIRLAKQNPRLMMNMRSILPDGTVTSKFFNNWPWARLWDGPQTVLFGHDADRGLQQYEHAIGLDTGCVYGGRLTACILPEKRLVSVGARREYFKYRRKHYD